MKRIFSILSVAVIFSLLIYSCKQDEISPEGNGGSAFRAGSLCTDCLTDTTCASVPDSVVFDGAVVLWDSTGGTRPSNPDPVSFNFTTGSVDYTASSGQLYMDNSFNSYFKGMGCWKVGYLPTSVSDINSLDCDSLKSLSSTSGICPSGLGYEVGACKGWYTYIPPGGVTPIRKVTVFCDANNNGIWDSCEKGYVVCVNIVSHQEQISPTEFELWATYTFKYKCCPATDTPCVE